MVENEVLPSVEEIKQSLKRGIEIFSPTFKLRGAVNIYYPKRHASSKYFLDYVPSRTDFETDYTHVYTLNKSQIVALNHYKNYNVLDAIFEMFNIDNPLSTDVGQEKVRAANASHTSMSVGDIIKVGKTYYIVANEGFKKLKWR